MKANRELCGMECVFSKESKILEFFEFSGIDLNGYEFAVIDASAFSNGARVELPERFAPGYFETLNQMAFVGERLVLQLYPAGAGMTRIDDLRDFENSGCEMVILMYDCYFVEVYCKNQQWIQRLIQNACGIAGAEVRPKYKDTDRRTVFYV